MINNLVTSHLQNLLPNDQLQGNALLRLWALPHDSYMSLRAINKPRLDEAEALYRSNIAGLHDGIYSPNLW